MAVNRLEDKIDAISLRPDSNTTPTTGSNRNEQYNPGTQPPLRRSPGPAQSFQRGRTPSPLRPREPFYGRQDRYQRDDSNRPSNQQYRDTSTYNGQSRNNSQFHQDNQQPSRGIIRQPSNQGQFNNQRRRVTFNNFNSELCRSCGSSNHATGTCRFRNFYCYNCGQLGHISRVCRSARPNTRPH